MELWDQDDAHSRAEGLLAGLNDAQLRAVTTQAAPLAILAGAGSGKTRVLTRRIAHRVLQGEIEPSRVLAVTFTRKAASELRSRVSALGLGAPVHAGTFHAIAYSQLRQRWAERGINPPSVLDRKVGFVARLLNTRSRTAPLDVTGEIEWAKARLIPADRYPAEAAKAGRSPGVDLDTVAKVFARYEDEKLARRMVDFDDLLRLATRDIVRDAEYAAARRWRYRHLFVDEFQDVNALQFELLQAWLGDRTDLCVVGDPNQAIYSWNGADASYLTRFDEWFPGAEYVELSHNYRSTPQILGVANTVLAAPVDQEPRRPGSRAPVQLVPTRGDGPIPKVVMAQDEEAEARSIARRVRDGHAPGRPWSAQAVLVRTNAQLPVIEEAFRKAGIPFRSRTGQRFGELPEVKDALRDLRRGPGRLDEKLRELERSLPADTAPSSGEEGEPGEDLDDIELVDVVPEEDEPAGEPDRRTGAAPDAPRRPGLTPERAANVAELVRLGREYLDLDPEGTPAGFESWLASSLKGDDGTGGGDAVDLATFHAAKGLEWPIVHVAGLEDGLVPIHHASGAEARAEERRLLYVALTRAEQVLWCSAAERRTFGTKTVRRRPSPYLDSIHLALELLSDRHDPVDLGRAVAKQRASMRASDGVSRKDRARRSGGGEVAEDDRALYEALREWRRQHAKAADVPAYVIFNDATLQAVAAARPGSQRALLTVPGIGPVKAQRFGPDLLRIVAEAG